LRKFGHIYRYLGEKIDQKKVKIPTHTKLDFLITLSRITCEHAMQEAYVISHTHTHTHTHTRIHPRTYTYTHVHTCSYVPNTLTHTHTPIHIHTHTRTYRHRTHTYTRMHAHPQRRCVGQRTAVQSNSERVNEGVLCGVCSRRTHSQQQQQRKQRTVTTLPIAACLGANAGVRYYREMVTS